MGMHDRGNVRPRFHDLQMQIALIDRLDPAFQPISVNVDCDDVIDVGIDKRATLGMDVTEDQHMVCAGNARADMAFGNRPNSAGGKDAMRACQTAPQHQYLGLERRLGVGMNGAMHRHQAFSIYFGAFGPETCRPSLRIKSSVTLSFCAKKVLNCGVSR